MGGLGNQLFQWSLYKRFEQEFGQKNVFIDDSFYTNHLVGTTKRNFLLGDFPNLKFSKVKVSDIKNESFMHIKDDFNFKNYCKLIDQDKNNNFYFDGYWQNYKYFQDVEEIIRQELFMDIEFKMKKSSTSLHVRRTDYCTSNGYHPVIEIDYYKQALEIFQNHEELYIFSDDISWCKENLKFENMIFQEDTTELEDLTIMSKCKQNIIANSTFSWWGAWLNNNPDKKVIAPKKWFGDHVNLNTSDLLPNNWIKI
jgi:hypothetical protein